jgi:hypothetical protein
VTRARADYPQRVLTDGRTQPPVTADRAARRTTTRKRKLPLAFLVVPVVLVALGVALFLVLAGGGGGGLIGIGDGDEDAPPFDFRVGRTSVEPTVADADSDALQAEADALVEEVTPVLDDLFTNAFLDPANWRNGDYEEVFELFADGAAASAQSGVEAITLGASAGDVYESVAPTRGGLDYTVLFDQEGSPDTVVVRVRFYALGERADGTFTAIVSAGQMFLRDLDGWKVTAFDMRRNDHETTPPTPAPSGTSPATTGATG